MAPLKSSLSLLAPSSLQLGTVLCQGSSIVQRGVREGSRPTVVVNVAPALTLLSKEERVHGGGKGAVSTLAWRAVGRASDIFRSVRPCSI